MEYESVGCVYMYIYSSGHYMLCNDIAIRFRRARDIEVLIYRSCNALLQCGLWRGYGEREKDDLRNDT